MVCNYVYQPAFGKCGHYAGPPVIIVQNLISIQAPAVGYDNVGWVLLGLFCFLLFFISLILSMSRCCFSQLGGSDLTIDLSSEIIIWDDWDIAEETLVKLKHMYI